MVSALVPTNACYRTVLALRPQLLRTLLPSLLLALAGLAALSPTVAGLWETWTTDALRSIGMLFPIVSAILTIRVWRRLGWQMCGTWWGLLLVFCSVAATHAGGNTFASIALGRQIVLPLLPAGLIIFSYASGVVLLFGGIHVWRQAIFPLSLLLFLNPVPSFFVSLVDLPLQYFSAHIARAFALALGVHPDGKQLRLMFAPEFGMFIAPGCNGIRGAITMAYLALILGYVYKFSIRLWTIAIIGGLILGYLFNLIRLCVLVLYYWSALHLHFMQSHAETADYVIGAILFLIGTTLFVLLVRENGQTQYASVLSQPGDLAVHPKSNSGIDLLSCKWMALFALVVLSASPYIYGNVVLVVSGIKHRGMIPKLSSAFPAKIGKYELRRSWEERGPAHNVIYSWGSYADSDSASEVEVGLYFPSGTHYASWCHISRGDGPVWSAAKSLPTLDGGAGTFAIDAYRDGNAYLLEASTICTPGGCEMRNYVPFHPGLNFRLGSIYSLIYQSSFRSHPLLIRKHFVSSVPISHWESIEANAELRDFIANLNTSNLVRAVEVQSK